MSECLPPFISISSAIIAACVLGVTVWQGRQNYKHNKMSVRPKLTESEDYQDDDMGINKLNVRINYQSIYEDETWKYDSKKDRLFQGQEVRNA